MTTTRDVTYGELLDNANLGKLDATLQTVKLGQALSQVKVVATGLTGAASFDITTAAVKAASTITGIYLPDGTNLPPIGDVVSLRVTAAGTGTTVGPYAITDAGGTALPPTTPGGSTVVGLALLSDDGKLLMFPSADVTAFVLTYRPRTAVAMSASPTNFPAP
jgi:hypothetical protein